MKLQKFTEPLHFDLGQPPRQKIYSLPSLALL